MNYTKPFENIWAKLPKGMKKGKFQAMKTWRKLNDSGNLPSEEELIKSINDQIKERKLLREQNKFCPSWPYFSSWLNAGRFDDECEKGYEPAPRVFANSSVDNMVFALGVLYDEGEAEFKAFCERVSMPPGDIEAVRFKYNGKYDVGRLARGIG
jgi:hypothetical protein